MRPKTNIKLGKGRYFISIKSHPNNILISRDSKQEAAANYRKYKAIGKRCEWLGKWDGKKYLETQAPEL